MPHGEIVLQPPPEIPEVASDGLQQMMTYLPMLAMTFGMVAMMSGSGSGSLRWVGGGAMGLGMGGMALGQMARGKGDRKLRLNGQRRDYLRYLGQIRRQVRRAASAQRQALEWTSPQPAALWWVMAANQHARVWERRPQDADFGTVRLGTGTQQLGVRLIPPQTKPAEDLDPLCAGALRRFIRTHARVPELPVGMSLRAFSRVCVAGDPGAARGMVRAMTAQLAAFHSPEEVRICVCAPADRMAGVGLGQVAAAHAARHRAGRRGAGPADGGDPAAARGDAGRGHQGPAALLPRPGRPERRLAPVPRGDRGRRGRPSGRPARRRRGGRRDPDRGDREPARAGRRGHAAAAGRGRPSRHDHPGPGRRRRRGARSVRRTLFRWRRRKPWPASWRRCARPGAARRARTRWR